MDHSACGLNLGDGDKHHIPIEVGSRVKSNEQIGTVRYIGEVRGRAGPWYGVEWDDPARGDHDGSDGDVHYFTTSKPGAGSFIRKDHIAPLRTFVEAMRLRYSNELMEMEEMRINNAKLSAERARAERLKVIDERLKGTPGPALETKLERISLDQLFKSWGSAELDNMNIAKAGDVSSLCPRVQHVTLTRSLIAGWQEVVNIAKQLTLDTLNLDNNRIALDIDHDKLLELSCHFDKLVKLSLQHCDYEWSDVMSLSHLWPKIYHLKVGSNRITHITPPSTLQTLTILNLNNNPLEGWQQVVHLGRLPSLRILTLQRCHIREIRMDDVPVPAPVPAPVPDGGGPDVVPQGLDLFNTLQHLELSHNDICDWQSIAELDKLRLKTLVFEDNPLVAHQDRDSWEKHIFAMVESIKQVNGKLHWRAEQRAEAERHYLHAHADHWLHAREDIARQRKFARQHPRYTHLVQKYGLPQHDISLTQQQPDQRTDGT